MQAKEYKYTRNDNGQIIRAHKTERDEWWKYTYTYIYTYNADGFVCRERFLIGGDAEPTDLKTSYTVDERGWVTTSVAKEWEGEWKTYTSTFTYADIDEYGNWHKANEKIIYTCEDGESGMRRCRITRKITYWEQ